MASWLAVIKNKYPGFVVGDLTTAIAFVQADRLYNQILTNTENLKPQDHDLLFKDCVNYFMCESVKTYLEKFPGVIQYSIPGVFSVFVETFVYDWLNNDFQIHVNRYRQEELDKIVELGHRMIRILLNSETVVQEWNEVLEEKWHIKIGDPLPVDALPNNEESRSHWGKKIMIVNEEWANLQKIRKEREGIKKNHLKLRTRRVYDRIGIPQESRPGYEILDFLYHPSEKKKTDWASCLRCGGKIGHVQGNSDRSKPNQVGEER